MALVPQLDGTGSFVCTCQRLDHVFTLILIPCSFFTTSPFIGFDAAGHVAEETRHAKHVEHPSLPVSPIDIKL